MNEPYPTRRSVSPGAERRLSLPPVRIHEHGWIELVDYCGTDEDIARSARVSYQKGTKQQSDTRGLIRYMLSHRHTTPFERCRITLRGNMPGFVIQQLLRHRTASVSQESLRYSESSGLMYVPRASDLGVQSKKNKQGTEYGLTPVQITEVREYLRAHNTESLDLYQHLLEKYDLSREQARNVLPVCTYSKIEFSFDLHNLFHMLKLRCDIHAQPEFRVYADTIGSFVKEWVPLAYEAWIDYSYNAMTLSSKEQEVFSAALKGRTLTHASFQGMTNREWEECMDKLAIIQNTLTA